MLIIIIKSLVCFLAPEENRDPFLHHGEHGNIYCRLCKLAHIEQQFSLPANSYIDMVRWWEQRGDGDRSRLKPDTPICLEGKSSEAQSWKRYMQT